MRLPTASGRGDIYLVDPDGSNVIRLTKGPGNSISPVWSPDGKEIAFTRLTRRSAPTSTS